LILQTGAVYKTQVHENVIMMVVVVKGLPHPGCSEILRALEEAGKHREPGEPAGKNGIKFF